MEESWLMSSMIIQCEHVDVRGFSWMMPWMSVQDDHLAVQGFSVMMARKSI